MTERGTVEDEANESAPAEKESEAREQKNAGANGSGLPENVTQALSAWRDSFLSVKSSVDEAAQAVRVLKATLRDMAPLWSSIGELERALTDIRWEGHEEIAAQAGTAAPNVSEEPAAPAATAEEPAAPAATAATAEEPAASEEPAAPPSPPASEEAPAPTAVASEEPAAPAQAPLVEAGPAEEEQPPPPAAEAAASQLTPASREEGEASATAATETEAATEEAAPSTAEKEAEEGEEEEVAPVGAFSGPRHPLPTEETKREPPAAHLYTVTVEDPGTETPLVPLYRALGRVGRMRDMDLVSYTNGVAVISLQSDEEIAEEDLRDAISEALERGCRVAPLEGNAFVVRMEPQ